MKILYIDVDSLRPDHLGCYGYPRNTSPHIDALAERGVRFTNYYASDAPCLPSRTALFSARHGIHTGVINHGGLNATMRPIGANRPFNHHHSIYQAWVETLRFKGHHTAIISPFHGRHGAWHILEGFLEIHDTGKHAGETANDVIGEAVKFIKGPATEKNDWFLYVNFWDPHTPYRTPLQYGNPFKDDPAPEWLTDEIITSHKDGFGPMSSLSVPAGNQWPDLPKEIHNRSDFKRWIDGYDTAVRFVDDHIGMMIDALKEQNLFDDTLIIISADHGENQGELNVYGDHQTADYITSRIPLIISGKGIDHPHVDEGLHYNIDLGPTLTQWVGGQLSPRWDGVSFLPSITERVSVGRPYVVVSQNAWSSQRSVRFDQWILIRTYHDGHKDFPDLMLFDIENDPHEIHNLADERPDMVGRGMILLDQWVTEQMIKGESPTDPMWEVIQEGGPYHTRGTLPHYLKRLREQGRHDAADRLEERHRKFGNR